MRPTRALALGIAALLGDPVPAETLDRLPADFIENRGQWEGPARFVGWKGGAVASLERDAIRLRGSVSLTFQGPVREDARLLGEGRRAGTYNFFVGNDRTKWRAQVPSFESVFYRGLYEGVDVRVREHGARLEYDLMLEPGADLEQIVIRAEGATGLVLESDGSLTLHTGQGTVRQTPPTTWDVLPSGEKRLRQARFRLLDGERYGFEVAERDPLLALVIDPGLEWSTFLGGGNREEIHGLALTTDGTGDVVVAGHTFSSDFPTAPPGALGTSPLITFVARLNASGTSLVYATLFGGTNGNVSYGYGLALDSTSAPVVVGETNAANFPTTPGAFQPTFNEPTGQVNREWDAFVTRFNASGSQMVFSTFLGAAPILDASRPSGSRGGYEGARAVVVDATDSVIVAGVTTSEDFPTTPGAYDRTLSTLTVQVTNPQGTVESRTDTFLARLSPSGTQLTYATYLGGQSDDNVNGMVIDPQGTLTLVGTEAPIETFDGQGNRTDHGIPFPTTADAVKRTHLGASDAFLARLRLDGAGAADLKYGTIFGGFYVDDAIGIALDPANSELITICGNNRSWDFPTTPGAFRRAPLFMADGTPYYSGFVSRFRFPATGSGSLVWSTLLVGTGTGQFADSVAIDSSGDVVVVGSDIAGGYPTTERSFRRLPQKGSFVSRFSGDGKTQLYSTLLHKPSGVLVLPMKVVASGPHAVVVAGSTLLPDHPTTPGAFDRVFGTNGTSDGFHTFDGFVAKLTLDPGTSVDTAASAPTLLAPANGASVALNGALTLDWADVTDASGVQLYEVEVSANADFLNGFTFFNTAAGTFSSSSASASTSQEGMHYWRVRTLDGVNNLSPWSEVRRFTVGAPTWTNFAAASLTPNGVAGGSTVVGKVHIQNVAPAGGQVYTLTSSNPAAASVPPSVTVPAGASSATFTVTTHPVSVSTPVQLTVWSEGNGEHPVLWVDPAASGGPTLASLSLSPTTVVGGTASTGTATLSAPAPSGGQSVTLTSDTPSLASVPPSVTVPAGSTAATFQVSTSPTATATTVTVTGVSGGIARTASLDVTPAGSGIAFRSPTANAADSGGDGNGFETKAASAHSDDTANAVDTNSGTISTLSCTSSGRDRHRFSGYGFSLPAGTAVQGIEVRLDARADATGGTPKMCVELSWNGGTTWTSAKVTPTLSNGMASYILGGAADTWGRAWTPSELSDAALRVRITNVANSTNRDFSLDWVAVRVTTGTTNADTTAPLVSVDSPAAGATVSGTTTLSATASDTVGVTRVEFLVDGALLSTDTTSPYSASWNTTSATNGSHTVSARAFDAAGNIGNASGVGVTVSNAPPPTDTTPPTVSLTAPTAGATVSGTVTVTATATDAVGVTRVEFLVDGALLSTDTTSPYAASWSTTAVANGAHTLSARAFDAAGNQGNAAGVGVTVSNGSPASLSLALSGVPTTIRRGQFFTATGQVTNTGGTAASGYTVLISFTPTDSMRLESPQTSSQAVPTVAAGGSSSVSWQLRADRTASATVTMTLRNSAGVTVTTASRTLTITD